MTTKKKSVKKVVASSLIEEGKDYSAGYVRRYYGKALKAMLKNIHTDGKSIFAGATGMKQDGKMYLVLKWVKR